MTVILTSAYKQSQQSFGILPIEHSPLMHQNNIARLTKAVEINAKIIANLAYSDFQDGTNRVHNLMKQIIREIDKSAGKPKPNPVMNA